MTIDLRDALQDHFGFPAFRDGQEEIIEILLAGRPALAVFPTGGGKSICYQLPAVLLEGLTLVVSPLIALMKDQVDALQERGIAAARLDSTLTAEEAMEIYDRMRTGRLKLLYVAPERLANENFRARLASTRVSLLAIDEAHCISEWGHNFRPDYLKLAKFARDLGISRVLSLTATATPKVAEDIRRNFGVEERDHIQLSFHRANLRLRITPSPEDGKRGILLDRLRDDPAAPTIIYGTRQETAESLAAFLKRNGLPARPYHAGLRDETRAACQEAFMSGEAPIITATIAFGMGIDKADIRRIIHYNLPKSLENYTQEIGRAGRDGEAATCELLACADDLRILENFVFGDTPSPEAVRRVLDQILDRGDEFDLSHYELAGVNDIRPLVINTLLTYLELDGFIAATRPFYTTYRVKLLRDLEQVLLGYDESRRKFLRAVFATGKEGRLWITIDPAAAAMELDDDRQRIVKALGHLESHGDLALKPSGIRHGYRRLRKPDDLAAVAGRMQDLFQRREDQDLARLRQVVSYAESGRCLNQHLLGHFGEAMEQPCGHCANCRGDSGGSGAERAGDLPGSPPPEIGLEHTGAIQALLGEKNGALRTPRQLARFLCGLTSPATTRARLTRHDAFALLEGHPFEDVLAYCRTLLIP
ncbi:MAG: RecQ family ATP-dependent DNA helicase [Akkermansiaceae bacterium]|nr:RecQ family ATP-dependent DNA helicase [Akkermansiaceae bacterium]